MSSASRLAILKTLSPCSATCWLNEGPGQYPISDSGVVHHCKIGRRMSALGHQATSGGRRAILLHSRKRTSRPLAFMSTRPSVMGRMKSKSPYDRHVAELTVLSVVSAEAATPCCQRER
jgi:hypothetical protein